MGFSANPLESEDAVLATFDGLESCLFCLFRSLQVCEVVDGMFCRNVVEISCGEEMI